MFRVPSLFRTSPEFRPTWGMQLPDTQVALTVHGKICWPNRGGALHLDAPLLRQFSQQDLVTTTDWSGLTGPQRFLGVDLMDVLLAAGWRGTRLTLTGADGHSVEAGLHHLRDQQALIATDWNGMPLPSTRFAPLWLVFPYDAAPSRLDRQILTRLSVWKLTEIEIA